jgi:hypothetical protein
MDKEALVYVDLDGVPHLMGRLWARTRKNKESATFEYDKTWLENPARFWLRGRWSRNNFQSSNDDPALRFTASILGIMWTKSQYA